MRTRMSLTCVLELEGGGLISICPELKIASQGLFIPKDDMVSVSSRVMIHDHTRSRTYQGRPIA